MAITSLFGSDWDLGDWMSSGTPVSSYNFVLVVEGLYDVPIKSIHSFKKENEFEMIQEGGLNDYVHMRRKPISRPFQFQIERYLGTDKFDMMSLGTDFILPLILCVSRWQKPSEANSSRFYVFLGASVIEKEYGTLDAEKSGLATETITIAYKELYAMNQNFFNTDGDTITNADGETVEAGEVWKFNPDVENRAGISAKDAKKGNKKLHANKGPGYKTTENDDGTTTTTYGSGTDYNELTREEMEAKANLWTFDATANSKAGLSTAAAKAGTGTASAAEPYVAVRATDTGKVTYGHGSGYTEPSQSDLEAKAKLWKYKKGADSKAGNSSEAAKKGDGKASAPASAGIAADGTYGYGTKYKEKLQKDLQKNAVMWEFNKTAASKAGISSPDSKKGSGKASANASAGSDGKTPPTYGYGDGYNEELRKAWEERASLWSFKGNETAGNNNRHYQSGIEPKQNKTTKQTMELRGNAKMWKFDKKAKEGNKQRHLSNDEPAQNLVLQTTWEGKSSLWEFKEKEKEGNAKRHISKNEPEENKPTRDAFEGKSSLWEFKEKEKEGNTVRHLSNNEPEENKPTRDAFEGKTTLWKFSKLEKEGNKTRHTQDDLAPDSNKKTRSDFEKKASLWKFSAKDKEGNKTRHTQDSLAPDSNKATKEDMEKKAVLWPPKESAIKRTGGVKPEERLWPQQKSAVYHTGGQDPQGRKWPATPSARKLEGGKKAEERLWPKQSSAEKPKGGKDPAPRRYPEVRSAVYRTEGKDPAPRRWPEMKSAVYITDILS